VIKAFEITNQFQQSREVSKRHISVSQMMMDEDQKEQDGESQLQIKTKPFR
jgi:hypothetical protein